jgi:hypothetical protein
VELVLPGNERQRTDGQQHFISDRGRRRVAGLRRHGRVAFRRPINTGGIHLRIECRSRAVLFGRGNVGVVLLADGRPPRGRKAPQQRKKKFIVFSVGLGLVGLVSFLYPLKFVPAEKRFDVFVGLVLAFSCIGGIGVVMWKVKRFLDADLKKSEDEDRP